MTVNYQARRKSVEADSNAVALDNIQTTAHSLDAYIGRVAMLPRGIAARQQALKGEPNENTMPFLRQLLESVPRDDAYGVYEAFERKHYTDDFAMPWVDRKSFPHRVHVRYDYHDADWYKGARQAADFYLTEPYFDKGGSNITMVSITKPFFAADGSLLGVAGADISIELINRLAGSLRLRPGHVSGSDGDYPFLVGKQGRIITHPDRSLMPSRNSPGAWAIRPDACTGPPRR